MFSMFSHPIFGAPDWVPHSRANTLPFLDHFPRETMGKLAFQGVQDLVQPRTFGPGTLECFHSHGGTKK